MLSDWGRLLVRFRWVAIAAGVAVAVLGAAWGGGVFKVLTAGGFDDPRSQSAQASDRIAADLGARDVDVVVLYSSPTLTVDDPAFKNSVDATVKALRQHREIAFAATYYDTSLPSMVSRDRHATDVAITLAAADQGVKQTQYKDIKSALNAPGLTTQIGGVIPLEDVTDDMAKQDIARGEMLAFPAVLILLILIFGGVVAAGMPLLVGILAILGAFSATRLIAEFTQVSTFAANTITLLGLGLAIDYSLLIVSRYRRELRTHEPAEAIARTMATAGRTVLVSGLTVVLALSSLLIFPLVFLRSIGMGGMSAVFVAMLTALTVLPAVLAVLGRRINAWRIPLPWGRGRSADGADAAAAAAAEGRGWATMAHNVMRRPYFHIVAVLALLAVFALPFLHVHFAGNDERVLPAGTEARVVSEQIAAHFPGGSDAPLDVFVGNATPAQVQAISKRIAAVPGITGTQLTDEKGSAALLTVGYSGPRTGDAAYNAVRTIRALPQDHGVQVLVGGRPAQDVDRLATLRHGLPWMAAIMAAATFVLLFLAFGSVLLPIQAVVMNMISIAASFGVIVWIFQSGHLSGVLSFTPTGFVEPTIPVLILAVLYGLATDYELFLISAVREARDATGDARAAIAAGLQRTGRIITAAALLLVVVVAGFSASGIVFTKMIGVGMVVAIIVDATLVRIVLLPAVLLLLGKAAWWAPGPLARIYRKAGIREVSELPEPVLSEPEPDRV